MLKFLTLCISGVMLGCIYGLIALGYGLIYKASGLMSFVQGDMLTLGAFLGLTFYSILGLTYWLSLLLTMLCAFAFGMLLEKASSAACSIKRSCRSMLCWPRSQFPISCRMAPS